MIRLPRKLRGRLAYRVGDYGNAERLLAHALADRASSRTVGPQDLDDRTMMENAARIVELMPSSTLPAGDRVERMLATRAIAKKRFDSCSAQFPAEQPLPVPLQALDTRWLGPDGTANGSALLREPALQDSALQLVFATEVLTNKLCGPASGDDALLLRLATNPHGVSAVISTTSAQAPVPHD